MLGGKKKKSGSESHKQALVWYKKERRKCKLCWLSWQGRWEDSPVRR